MRADRASCQAMLMLVLSCCGSGVAMQSLSRRNVIPESLRGTPLGRELAAMQSRPPKPTPKCPTRYLHVPLDHFDPENPKQLKMRYWVINASWDGSPAAPLVLDMPGEGGSSPALNIPTNITATFRGVQVATEHRFFGDTVPGNESTVANLAFLSVEQNLADLVALVSHVKAELGLTGPVIAQGGSYSGASTCWLRSKYPNHISAGVAESASIHAKVNFFEYDQELSSAIRKLSPRCEDDVAAMAKAVDDQWADGEEARTQLKLLFGQNTSVGTTMGDVDFLYMMGDSVASSVQYGGKAQICDHLRKTLPADPSPADRISNWANFTLTRYGATWPTSNWYNSEAMRQTEGGSSARSWYWLKCSELACEY